MKARFHAFASISSGHRTLWHLVYYHSLAGGGGSLAKQICTKCTYASHKVSTSYTAGSFKKEINKQIMFCGDRNKDTSRQKENVGYVQ